VLSDIVDVTILEQAVTSQIASFSTCMLVAQIDVADMAARFTTFETLAEVQDAGLGTAVEDAAAIFFSQNPNPGELTIGRQVPGTAQVSHVAITTADDGTWSFSVNSDAVSYLASGSDTLQTIAEGLASAGVAIFARHNVTASTPTAGAFDLTANVPGDAFTISSMTVPGTGAGATTTPTANVAAEDIDDALTAIRAAGNTSFRFCIQSRLEANVDLASAWAAAQAATDSPALFIAQMVDTSIRDATGGNPAEDLYLLGYDTTHIEWAKDATEFRDVAVMSAAAAVNLDQATNTWALKGLIGVTAIAGAGVEDPVTSAQLTNLKLHANVYEMVGGLGTTFPGKVVSGKYTDTVVSRFWLRRRLQEAGYGVLRGSPTKIPMNLVGATMLEGAYRSVCATAERAGHIEPGWTVTVPDPATLTSAQRASRVLSGAVIRARFTGAIHQTDITVYLQY
jgi:hypothetical protein